VFTRCDAGPRSVTVLRWGLASAGYLLLILAWSFASPLGAAPDEPAQAVRAAATAAGTWPGSPASPYHHIPGSAGLTPSQADFLNQQTQEVSVPSRLLSPLFGDQGGLGGPSPMLTLQTYANTASPFVYTVAAAGIQFLGGLVPPLFGGRVALGLLCALLLAGALWAAGGWTSQWPVVGVELAATPMVLFLAASLGPAGVAICASICVAACVTAIWTDAPRAGPVVAFLGGASALILAVDRPSGLLALGAVTVAMLPLAEARMLRRPALLLGLALAAAGTALGVIWVAGHQPLPALGGTSVFDGLVPLSSQAQELTQQMIGAFGPTPASVQLPWPAYLAWGVITLLAIGAALVLSRGRERLALGLAIGAVVAIGAVEVALVLAPLGWDLQGRYLLPAAVIVPVIAGFLLHRAELPVRLDAPLVGLAVAGLQLFAFWENARTYAVGRHGPFLFLGGTVAWSPPGGWVTWVVVAIAGSCLLAMSMAPLTRWEREGSRANLLVDPDLVSVSR
jgi:hypothetical protein